MDLRSAITIINSGISVLKKAKFEINVKQGISQLVEDFFNNNEKLIEESDFEVFLKRAVNIIKKSSVPNPPKLKYLVDEFYPHNQNISNFIYSLCQIIIKIKEENFDQKTKDFLQVTRNEKNKSDEVLPNIFKQIDLKYLKKELENNINEVKEKKTYFESRSNFGKLLIKKAYIEPEVNVESEIYAASTFFEKYPNKKCIILSKAGNGKSLLLYMRFLSAAEKFLKNQTLNKNDKYPIYLDVKKYKTQKLFREYTDNFINKCPLEVEIYLDGLNELNISLDAIANTGVLKKCVLITCRNNFYENNINLLESFLVVDLLGWNETQAREYIKIFSNKTVNLEDFKINQIYSIINKNIDIRTPLLITLFLFVLQQKNYKNLELFAQEKDLETYILKNALEQYIEREINKFNKINKNNAIDLEKAMYLISHSCWFYFCFMRKNPCDFNYLLKEMSKIYDDKNLNDFLHLIFEENEGIVILNEHQTIVDFFIAYRIIYVYRNDESAQNFLYTIYNPEIAHYIIALLKWDDNFKSAFKWQNKYYSTGSFTVESYLFFINLIVPISKCGYPEEEIFLENELKKEALPIPIKVILYDALVQYANEPKKREEFEEKYFNDMLTDEKFLKSDIGCRLTYYQCTKDEKLIIEGDNGICGWEKLFHACKKHFEDKELSKKYYFLRRIELYIIKYLLETRNTKQTNPKFYEEVKEFVFSIKNEINEFTEKGSVIEFNNKVKSVFDDLLTTINNEPN